MTIFAVDILVEYYQPLNTQSKKFLSASDTARSFLTNSEVRTTKSPEPPLYPDSATALSSNLLSHICTVFPPPAATAFMAQAALAASGSMRKRQHCTVTHDAMDAHLTFLISIDPVVDWANTNPPPTLPVLVRTAWSSSTWEFWFSSGHAIEVSYVKNVRRKAVQSRTQLLKFESLFRYTGEVP